MPDVNTAPGSLCEDAARGPYPRFSAAALERAKHVFGVNDVDKIGEKLGWPRASFWRVRIGRHDPRLSRVRAVSQRLGMPLDEVFEDVPDV